MSERRPNAPAQLAKFIVDIATGEVEDREPTPEEQGKDPAAKGGTARAKTVTAERRVQIARLSRGKER
jgi:hypothetical protein